MVDGYQESNPNDNSAFTSLRLSCGWLFFSLDSCLPGLGPNASQREECCSVRSNIADAEPLSILRLAIIVRTIIRLSWRSPPALVYFEHLLIRAKDVGTRRGAECRSATPPQVRNIQEGPRERCRKARLTEELAYCRRRWPGLKEAPFPRAKAERIFRLGLWIGPQ